MNINDKMIECAKRGDLKELKICIRNGANLTYRGDEAFYIASVKGFADIVKYCLKMGRKLCKQCFHMAAQEGHLEVVKIFVKLGIDIDSDYSCAFRWACANGHIGTARYLYNKGCKVFEHDGYDIRHSAANGHLPIVKFLFKIGATKEHLEEARQDAESNGHKKVVSFLERTLIKGIS